jgi:ABC-type uncharacterized transport system permease subunit
MTWLAVLGVLSSAIFSGASLLYATLGEVVGQRSGVVNLGLEGVMLVGAAAGFAATVASGNPWLGTLVAVIAGALMNLILGWLVVHRGANQPASGLALMFFGFGLSALIGQPYVGTRAASIPRIPLPGTAGLPPRIASLVSFDPLIYFAVPIALLVWWLLYRTRWGLVLRATGESVPAVHASGRNAGAIRYQALFVAGMLAGLGAAHLAIAYTMTWTEHMTGGRGFIAVALVIFSGWHPLRAIYGALLFSGAVAFQLLLQSAGVRVSPFLLDMIPFLLTILVLAVSGGGRRHLAPAGLGRLYGGRE